MNSAQKRLRSTICDVSRLGTVLVEFALVISVFAVFMAGVIEFGHAYLVYGTINAAARGAARFGSVEDVTSSQVEAEARRIMEAGFRQGSAIVRIKDASTFDAAGFDPSSVNYASLPDVDVSTLETGAMFLVQIEVPYADVALMPPLWAQSIVLRCQSIVRHE